MHQTEAVAAVVADVLCPSFALDINKNVRLRLLELHSNNRWQVARGMPVGEVIGGEPLPWGVTDGTDVFFVGWVLSLAGYPDHLGYFALVFVGALLDVIFQRLGHICGELLHTSVHIRNPVDHLIELEQNARRFAVVAPALGLLALALQPGVLEAADLTITRQLVFGTVGHVLARNHVTGAFVGLDELIERLDPMLDVSAVTVLVPDQSGFNIFSSWQGSETHGWVLEDGVAATRSVLGEMVDVKSLVEDGHHDCEETGEACVEDQVEYADLQP